jgi:hypothetical protein
MKGISMVSREAGASMGCLPASRTDLSSCLNWIWEQYFSDVPRSNEVAIEYRYPWKNRLGLIRLSSDSMHTWIEINTLLQLPVVPDVVLLITVAHELTHYAHGFGSPLPRKYAFPHAHQVVNKELKQRNLGAYLAACEAWIDQYWFSFYEQQRSSGWSGVAGPNAASRRS